ncbi:Junctophilin-1 like protein [Argiope bruennichi]|uniref:Junctophilin-1 like protein n=1 Tax=Argiope bruennichi TaxID=94029 RepID=A0A8T0FGI1_ARGBR|nr:Junctophilin-1 like protein [Argiope bruennichi]
MLPESAIFEEASDNSTRSGDPANIYGVLQLEIECPLLMRPDGTEEKGKYKNNVLLTSGRQKHLFLLRSPKFRERIEAAINGAHRASQIALQKADIAISRTATARGKAEQADEIAKQARAESDLARLVAKNYAPEFAQPGTGFLKRKFPSSQGSDFGQFHTGEDPSRRSFLPSNPEDPYTQKDSFRQSPEFEDFHLKPEPPTQSAFLDVFRNTSDRRPSTAGFLRRPSAVNLNRRPSTVVELNLRPSQINVDQRQEPFPNRLAVDQYRPSENQYRPSENQYRPSEDQYRPTGDQYRSPPEDRYYPPYNQSREQYNRPTENHYYPPENRYRSQPPPVTIQQVITDHLSHYYEDKPQQKEEHRNHIKKPAIDLTELSKLYGIPLSGPTMDDEEAVPFIPQRRSTLPTVMDQNCLPVDSGEGMVRTGSLYSATRKIEAAAKTGSLVNARKNSLPDISNAAAMESRVLSRETIAILSSQRREAIRRQEEQAERLRANPFLYLVSPEVWDWLSSQQLTILVLVVNVALGNNSYSYSKDHEFRMKFGGRMFTLPCKTPLLLEEQQSIKKELIANEVKDFHGIEFVLKDLEYLFLQRWKKEQYVRSASMKVKCQLVTAFHFHFYPRTQLRIL